MGENILVIDEGTTSTRAMLFAPDGGCLACEQSDLEQHYPRPGWVEHDAEEIWEKSLACAQRVARQAGGADRIAALGITNQRETIIFWSRRTGRALAPAIVWQDRRTAALCARLKEQGREKGLQERTGLLLDPYFSGSKIAWAMAEWPQLAEAGADLAVGTVESWLVWRLTGGLHVSDATNASRTALMDIRTGLWDAELLDLFDAPVRALPEIVDCAGIYGSTTAGLFGAPLPICGMAGDQQAAAIGQACLREGETKATYGTGAFVLTHTGAHAPVSRHRLLSTVAWRLDGRLAYALEGSVFVAGSLIKWLRDDLELIASSAETSAIAGALADSGGVYVVPAHCGLGAPHWRPEARGLIAGLSFGTRREHIVRAGLEVDGAPDPRSDDRLRRRWRRLGAAEDRRRHGRQRLAGAGPGRHARPRGRASGVRRDHRARRRDAGRGGGGPVRLARRGGRDARPGRAFRAGDDGRRPRGPARRMAAGAGRIAVLSPGRKVREI